MPPADEANLVAVRARGRAAVEAIARAWDRGDAVAPLDPRAPAAAIEARLSLLRPTHVDDGDGPRCVERDDGPGRGEPVPAAVAAVLPTSGTTGAPRAVQLDHDALAASARAVHAAIGCEPDDAWLCCVPVHHVAGLAIVNRARVHGLPLVVHDGFDVATVGASPQDDATTLVSLVATMLTRLLDAGAPVERFRVALLGGGPIPRDLVALAHERGAHVATTDGMTETGGGCVHDGHALPGVDVRVAADGEIQVLGPVVMRGYHRDPDATRDAFTRDGWLRTGDVGEIDEEGFVRITGRMKEILVTAGGKNVAPSVLEDRVRAHPLVSQCLVVGDGRPFIAALVTIDPDAFADWAAAHDKTDRVADHVEDPDLLAEVQKAIDDANAAVSRAESIRKFLVLPLDWTEESGQLTPSLKLKRNVVVREHKDDIAALFA
jgi:long-subunit acyl-CoA synthetase (AMP-forming)